MSETLVDIMPAKVRRVVYAILGFAAAFSAVVISALTDGFQPEDIPVLIVGLANAGGFAMAAANTKS